MKTMLSGWDLSPDTHTSIAHWWSLFNLAWESSSQFIQKNINLKKKKSIHLSYFFFLLFCSYLLQINHSQGACSLFESSVAVIPILFSFYPRFQLFSIYPIVVFFFFYLLLRCSSKNPSEICLKIDKCLCIPKLCQKQSFTFNFVSHAHLTRSTQQLCNTKGIFVPFLRACLDFPQLLAFPISTFPRFLNLGFQYPPLNHQKVAKP